MLATVKTLYAYLADVGLVEANPAALNRRRLGLATATTSTSSTITLTSRQVRALHAAAASARRGASPLDTARAVAVVALFTLGLRVSELCGLDRADLHVTRGRRALRVRGKGGKVRIVYLSVPTETALTDYLKSAQAAVPQPAADVVHGLGPPIPQQEPLLCTRNGRRFQRQAIWQLLRRVAARGSHDLQAIADAIHPHALRHFYVTTAVEAGAQLAHIQGMSATAASTPPSRPTTTLPATPHAVPWTWSPTAGTSRKARRIGLATAQATGTHNEPIPSRTPALGIDSNCVDLFPRRTARECRAVRRLPRGFAGRPVTGMSSVDWLGRADGTDYGDTCDVGRILAGYNDPLFPVHGAT
jgi:site-specific recombinase XerD